MLAVPHRLSSIREADKDIVLEQRHVVVRGCLAELKALDGFYAELWRLHASERFSLGEGCESCPAAAWNPVTATASGDPARTHRRGRPLPTSRAWRAPRL